MSQRVGHDWATELSVLPDLLGSSVVKNPPAMGATGNTSSTPR